MASRRRRGTGSPKATFRRKKWLYSPSGAYAGIGFAIPVDIVRWVVPELIKHGKIMRPGLAVALASDRMIERLQLPGVLILEVSPRSNAGLTGLRPTRRTQFGEIVLGDIILAVDQISVRNNKDLLLLLEKYRVGDRVTLRVLRGGTEVDIEVELETAE